jgi:transposase
MIVSTCQIGGHMNTNEQAISMGRRRRRRHSADFKADAVAACLQPDVSIAAVALSRGLNANLLRRWLVEAERTGGPPVRPPGGTVTVDSGSRFVPIPLPSGLTEAMMRIELRSGSGTVIVQWPVSAASGCAALLRELTR